MPWIGLTGLARRACSVVLLCPLFARFVVEGGVVSVWVGDSVCAWCARLTSGMTDHCSCASTAPLLCCPDPLRRPLNPPPLPLLGCAWACAPPPTQTTHTTNRLKRNNYSNSKPLARARDLVRHAHTQTQTEWTAVGTAARAAHCIAVSVALRARRSPFDR